MSASSIVQLLVGTKNSGKFAEISSTLSDLPLQLHSLLEFPQIDTADEVGSSYSENAILKAQSYARQVRMPALADDSGLEVDALEGAPGLFSARYAGPASGDQERVNFLLSQLSSQDKPSRKARFVCVIAVVDPEGRLLNLAQGICEGSIAFAPRGQNGFGFDPIFVPHGYNSTFAELTPLAKERIGHRGRALRSAKSFLQAWLRRLDRDLDAS